MSTPRNYDEEVGRSFLECPSEFGGDKARTDTVIKIKPVDCLNEFVAVLPFKIETDIVVPNVQYKNEGVVIGIGPGLPDNAGGRTKSQLQLGDVVVFQDRNVVLKMDDGGGYYKNNVVLIISEKSLICRLDPVKFEVLDA